MPPVPGRADLARRLAQLADSARAAIDRRRHAPLSARPIRGALLGVEQLEERARELAAQHQVERQAGSARRLLDSLRRNERLLRQAHRAISEDAQAQRPLAPAAEWLLDNYYVVVDQIREVRQDLPQGYYHELPKLADGPYRGLPRTYALALALIEHADGRVEQEQLARYLAAYQTVAPLTIGEVWAIAIMLRVGLIENVGRLAQITLDERRLRAEADSWADRLTERPDPGPLEGNAVLRALTRAHPQLPTPLAVQLLRHLREREGDFDVGALITWLEQHPALPFKSADELFHAEHRRQAANQVSVANTITAMRTLSAMDWAAWFERVCLTEQVLRQDPSGVYARSTFVTRDRYRHELELLARGSGRSEGEVARLLVERARKALVSGRPEREAHIGYALVDGGRPSFEAEIDTRRTAGERIAAAAGANREALYLGAIAGVTAGVVAAGVRLAAGRQPSPARAVAAAALTALPASALATELVNRAVSKLVRPRVLPRLDLRDGIPPELRTIVVVPMLLLTRESVASQIGSLEVLAIANSDPQLHFALLSDFADSPEAEAPTDGPLLELAAARIRELNERYGAGRFLLLHRRRVWSETQGVWMGWERKRGKLEEFNRLLAGATDTTFATTVGDLSVLPQVRYVITLDADTQLPRDVARALVGAIAHPLNRAVVDEARRQVTAGYGIMQPRVSVDVASATASRFARLFSGNVGVDPYTTAVSDAYMDVFGEGIYAGKGIYDPHVLRQTIDGRFPESTLLSHDLIEGCYARAALLSDAELIDGYPTTYAAYAARQHRWVRGDWQIAAWLLPRVPGPEGALPNTLPLIARWKIFDNLRRSLVPPAALALLGAGWLWLPGSPLAWAGLALAPYLAPLAFELRPGADARAIVLAAQRALVNIALLPDQAAINLDAIARTLARVAVTRRKLLEWETAAQADQRLRSSSGALARRTLPALAASGALAIARAPEALRALPAALPVVGAWASAPALAGWLDRPYAEPPAPLAAPDDRDLLRRVARATWDYFERYVVEEQHFLAPDNVQETPQLAVAARTSPTNVGLQLLADLAACDLGYLGVADLVARTERVLDTLDRLERHRGHLLNWYDTATLAPLPPAYVSTVDSGNMAGALMALRAGLRELLARPLFGPWAPAGLLDTLELARAALGEGAALPPDLAELAGDLRGAAPATLAAARALLEDSAARAGRAELDEDSAEWAKALARQAASLARDLGLAGDSAEAPPPSLAEADTPQARELAGRIAALCDRCAAWVDSIDFAFLYDDERKLFTIGYSVAEGRLDRSYYDLLASEARLASFIAIARGDVPQEHWFHMGRALTPAAPVPTLLSWSGTMFEYLMPLLLMRRYPDTLLDSTSRGAVARQISYGRERGIPWGISESGYNARDLAMNYQYRAFGVPGLGMQPGRGEDFVVAPYATLLALPVDPPATVANLRALIDLGMLGRSGLYEAVDYTLERLPPGARFAVVRSFMVHHQAMGLVALANYLCDDSMQRRFHSDPAVQATELLLQERIPQAAPLALPPQVPPPTYEMMGGADTVRRFRTPHTVVPHAHLISSGDYIVALTNAGGGFSRVRDLAVTRWRADVTADPWGSFVYVRDTRGGAAWSPSFAPMGVLGDDYEASFALEKAEFRQRVAGIDTRLEVTVSPEDQAEVRRLSLTNTTAEPRELEVTSYAEIVLAPAGADAAHPAFAKLFVETELLERQQALLASRRPRSASEKRTWAVHAVAVRGFAVGELQHETSRAAFLGRGRTPAAPQALDRPLGGSVGAVLDPIFSLRRRLRIPPGGTAQVIFTTAVAGERAEAEQLAERYRDPAAAARAFEVAWTQSRVELRHVGITADQAQRFQRLASLALYPDPLRRAPAEVIAANAKGQNGLWAYGISGDEPIVLLRVAGDDLSLVGELLAAHEYWRLKGVLIDLVLLNEDPGGYRQERQDQLLGMVRASRAGRSLNQRGGVFVLRSDLVPEEDQTLLQTVARVVLSTRRGALGQQLRRRASDAAAAVTPGRPAPGSLAPGAAPDPGELALRGAYGGFTPDGCEYVVELRDGRQTPAPWANVVASERAGFVVSERGAGYTWAENSRENRLTPWANDPVSDQGGEALYLRDEATGEYWSPAPFPAGGGAFVVRHGFGYTTFQHERGGVASELTLTLAGDDPVKLVRLRLSNRSGRARRLTAICYVEWVLGVLREQTAPTVVTEWAPEQGAVLARNVYATEFAGRVAFLSASAPVAWQTAERAQFMGRNGSLARPAALDRAPEQGQSGAGLDPCAALACAVDLPPGGEAELFFLLGQGQGREEALALAARYRDPAAAGAAADATAARWRDLLGRLTVRTPDPSLDALLNGWLLYQTLACRVEARSALYQSGGAYGFRDQLQDVMALAGAAPELTRAQLLRAASRQFVEGDVQHWWHPPSGRGIRTNFSDDYIWLPFVAAHYVGATGDWAALDEQAPYLEGRALKPDEAEYYDLPEVSAERGPLYDHCVRALDRALGRLGQRGLPLMGAGDWNDGMNLVGHAGRGESVWVAWFLAATLDSFAPLAERRGDGGRASGYRAAAQRLRQAVEASSWDGAWYLRAFYDDGSPLGSSASDECQIDSLTQSWAVIAGGDPRRARQGMESADDRLVDRGAGLIKLFTPPFDRGAHDPGYIKGYVPGVRENGGQYTHAAIWLVWAWAALGEGGRAAELLHMISPVTRANQDPERYMVEPYVVAADVYTAEGHLGRGGWTWYTGSAGWMYRLGVEQILGLRREGGDLVVDPRLPTEWPGFEATVRVGGAAYRVSVERGDAPAAWLDGRPLDLDGPPRLPLADDGAEHAVRVVIAGVPVEATEG